MGMCKILLVEFFNLSEKIARRSEFNSAHKGLLSAEDRELVDQSVDRWCTNVHKEHSNRPPCRLLKGSSNRWRSPTMVLKI